MKAHRIRAVDFEAIRRDLGRDPDLENVQALIERLGGGGYERSLVYSGRLRGVGETVLLMEFDVLASEAGWATTDVQEVGSQPDSRLTFARMAKPN